MHDIEPRALSNPGNLFIQHPKLRRLAKRTGNLPAGAVLWMVRGGMDEERLTFYREKLGTLDREIREDMAANEADSGVVELDSSIGRLSRMDALQNQQMALELKRRQENQLLRIENALKRMEKGQYGLCGKCKKPIEEERLEVFPDTVTCVRCA